jgi:hypothetical protein
VNDAAALQSFILLLSAQWITFASGYRPRKEFVNKNFNGNERRKNRQSNWYKTCSDSAAGCLGWRPYPPDSIKDIEGRAARPAPRWNRRMRRLALNGEAGRLATCKEF